MSTESGPWRSGGIPPSRGNLGNNTSNKPRFTKIQALILNVVIWASIFIADSMPSLSMLCGPTVMFCQNTSRNLYLGIIGT